MGFKAKRVNILFFTVPVYPTETGPSDLALDRFTGAQVCERGKFFWCYNIDLGIISKK